MFTNRKALVVGINEYNGEIRNLRGCINDAKAIQEVLKEHDNGDDNFFVERKSNLSTFNFKKEIEWILKGEKGEYEIALIYFSGHGFITDEGGYLVSSNANKREIGISMGELNQQISKSNIPEIVVILDCCHADAMACELEENMQIAQLRKGVSIMAATRYKDVAIESKGRGIFTASIVEGLSGGAADFDGYVTAASLYHHTDNDFSPKQQRPVYKSYTDNMKPLRKCASPYPKETLKKIALPVYSELTKKGMQLSTSMIPESECEEGISKKYLELSIFEKAGLIRFDSQNTLIQAVFREEKAYLSLKGEIYLQRLKKENKQ